MQIVAVENHETPTNESAIMKALLAGFILGSAIGGYFGYKIGQHVLVNTYIPSKPAKLEPLSTTAKPISEKTTVKGTIKKVYEVARYNPTSTYVMFDAIIPKQNHKMDDTYKFVCASPELPMNAGTLEKLLNEQIGSEISIKIEKEKLKTSGALPLNLIDIIQIGEYDYNNLLKTVLK